MIDIKVYLAGQITADPRTYEWRKEIWDYFYTRRGLILDKRFIIKDPCRNKFSQEALKKYLGSSMEFKEGISSNKVSNILPSRDLGYVFWSNVGIANMNHYDKTRPFIGTLFELCGYFLNPTKTVIGILNGDPDKDANCFHPFVRKTVDVWTKDPEEACKILEDLF